MEKIILNLEKNFAKDGILDYEKYIDEQFPIDKKK